MRIVGGALKGRGLKGPQSDRVRPTSDRAREALFNRLAHSADLASDGDNPVRGAHVIDLFAGTGALGLEALSRDARFALFVDASIEGRSLVRANIQTCGVAARARLFKRDATQLGARGKLQPSSLAFLDPPYGQGLGERAMHALHKGDWLSDGALIVLEERTDQVIDPPRSFVLLDTRAHGESQFWFYRYRPS